MNSPLLQYMSERTTRDEIALTVTFTTDTSAYAASDLIADTELVGAVNSLRPPGVVHLIGVHLVDKADQKVALSFVFLKSDTSLGTINSAPNISDANVTSEVVGQVTLAATDYVDAGGAGFASKQVDLPIVMGSAENLYVGIVNAAGTPTYGASDLVATFVFSR